MEDITAACRSSAPFPVEQEIPQDLQQFGLFIEVSLSLV